MYSLYPLLGEKQHYNKIYIKYMGKHGKTHKTRNNLKNNDNP